MLDYLKECKNNTVRPVPGATYDNLDIEYMLETISDARNGYIELAEKIDKFAKEYGLDGKYDEFDADKLKRNYIDVARRLFEFSKELENKAYNMQNALDSINNGK